jgi:hypothetical protein
MAYSAKKNYAKGELSSGINDTDLSFTLSTGQGSLFTNTGSGNYFWGVFWSASEASPFQDATREIVKCYRNTGDTFTITNRAQEGTVAKSWIAGSNFMLTLTSATIEEIQTVIDGKEPAKGVDDNYVTDAEKIVIGNTSGTNTGDNAANSNIPVKATGAEVDTGTDDDKFVTTKALKDSNNVPDVAPSSSGNVMTSNGSKWTSAAPAGGGGISYAPDTGSANAYAVAPTSAWTSYTDGETILFRAANANTGASTLNVSSLGILPLMKKSATALAANDVLDYAMIMAAYNSKLVDSYSETNVNTYYNIGYTNTGVGQTFTGMALGSTIAKAYLRLHGSPTGNIVAKIYAITGSYGSTAVPTGSALATSSNVDVTSIGASAGLITFTFPTPYTIAGATNYALTFEYSGGDANNYVEIGIDNSTPSHDGNLVYNDGSWKAVAGQDVAFYIYGGRFEMLSQIGN